MAERPRLMLEIPEDVAMQLSSLDQIPEIHDEDAVVQLAEAVSEVAQALVETGRPIRRLHALRVCIERAAVQRGYRDGWLTACEVWRALLKDAPRREEPTS